MRKVSRRGFLIGSGAALVTAAFKPTRFADAGVLDRLFGRSTSVTKASEAPPDTEAGKAGA